MGIGIKYLAINLPEKKITNEILLEKFPQNKKINEGNLEKLFKKQIAVSNDPFDIAMSKYINDPFKGAKERYHLGDNETSLSLEEGAAKKILKYSKDKIDLLICCSFIPDNIGAGNAAYLIEKLNLKCPGINLESACSSSVVAFHMARDLITSKSYKNILIVTSVTNSRFTNPSDTLGWFLGDCSTAFLVGEIENVDCDILSHHTESTILLNDMFKIKIKTENNEWKFETQQHPNAGKNSKETAQLYLEKCVNETLNKSKLAIDQIDYFIFNTPMAWYHDFCGNVLKINNNKYLSVFPEYGNIGNCLMPVTLYTALQNKKIKENDIILFYSIGSTSTASCLIFKTNNIVICP